MPRRVAYLVANQDFRRDSGLANLRGPLNDIASLANVLGDPSLGQFEVKTFVNSTSFAIKAAIDEELEMSGKGDLILVHYSGHGKLDRLGNLCLATSDTRAAALQATSIPSRQLRDLAANSDCEAMVLILDCCYSGAATSEARGDIESQLISLENASGFYILSASSEIQTTNESAEGGITVGEFTSSFLDGIRTGQADYDLDGKISLYDLFRYVKSKIKHQSPKLFAARAGGDPIISLSNMRAEGRLATSAGAASRPGPKSSADTTNAAITASDLIPPADSDYRSFFFTTIHNFPHPEPVVDITFNREGTKIATVCNDGKVRIFDLKYREQIRVLQARPHTLRSASWSRTGRQIATADSMGLIRLWRDGAQVAQFSNGREELCYAEYGPSGFDLVAGSKVGVVSMWHPQREKLNWSKRVHAGSVNSVRFSDDGQYVVTASADGSALVLETASGEECCRYSGKDGELAAAFFISGNLGDEISCVSASVNGNICIWNTQGTASVRFSTKHQFWVRALSYCSEGQFIISGGYDATVKLIDLRSGNVFEATNVYGGSINSVRSSPDATLEHDRLKLTRI
jgi:WD40 repeat protein